MQATYGERILILLVAGAIGFAIGPFLCPNLMAEPEMKARRH